MGVGWNTARTRHWTRVTAKEARKQTRLMRQPQWAPLPAPAAAASPPGWYRCAGDGPDVLRWWTGAEWTTQTHELPSPQ